MPCGCSNPTNLNKVLINENNRREFTFSTINPYNNFVQYINKQIVIDLKDDTLLKEIIDNAIIPKKIQYIIEGKYILKSTTNELVLGVPEIEFYTDELIYNFLNTRPIKIIQFILKVKELLKCEIKYALLFLKNLKKNYEPIFDVLMKLYEKTKCEKMKCEKMKKFLNKIKNDSRFNYCPEKNIIIYKFDSFFVDTMYSLNNFLNMGKYYQIDNNAFPIPNYVDNFYKLSLMIKYIRENILKNNLPILNDITIKREKRPFITDNGKYYQNLLEYYVDNFKDYLKKNNLSGSIEQKFKKLN